MKLILYVLVPFCGPGYEWVGWKNDSRGKNPVEITFEFDSVRNFSAIHVYVNNFFTRDTQVSLLCF